MNVTTFLNTSSDLPVANVWTVDKTIIDFFNSLGPWGNFALIAISLVLTILLVGVIGFEREYRGHNAGLRTHVLVALGSAIIMVVSMAMRGSTTCPCHDQRKRQRGHRALSKPRSAPSVAKWGSRGSDRVHTRGSRHNTFPGTSSSADR